MAADSQSREDVREHVSQAIQQGIAAGPTVDDIETILDEQAERLERVRVFEEGSIDA